MSVPLLCGNRFVVSLMRLTGRPRHRNHLEIELLHWAYTKLNLGKYWAECANMLSIHLWCGCLGTVTAGMCPFLGMLRRLWLDLAYTSR